MSSGIVINRMNLDDSEVLKYLQQFDDCFNPPFSNNVILIDYANKLAKNANFIVAIDNQQLIGLLAYYNNPDCKRIYIPYLVVAKNYQGKSIGQSLIQELLELSKDGYEAVFLEVLKDNEKAYCFYRRLGFVDTEDRCERILLSKTI